MNLRLRRIAAIRRALDLALYGGAYDRRHPAQVLRALDDAVTSLGLTTIPLTVLRELRYDLESRPPAPPVLRRREEFRPVISDHVAAAVRERQAQAGEDDQPFGTVQVMLAVADGLARAGLAVEAHYVTVGADQLAAEGDR